MDSMQLEAVLKNTALELERIAKITIDIETDLFQWQEVSHSATPLPLSIQSFDTQTQKLQELSLFLTRLSEGVDKSSSVLTSSIVSKVKLESLRKAIVLGKGGIQGAHEVDIDGSIDLF